MILHIAAVAAVVVVVQVAQVVARSKVKISRRQLRRVISETLNTQNKRRQLKRRLRASTKKDLQLEFFGFGKKKVPLRSDGRVDVIKLPKDQQDLYRNIKIAVKENGDPKAGEEVVKSMGADPKENAELIKLAIQDGKVAFGHSNKVSF